MGPLGISVGGILPIKSAKDLIEQQKRQSEITQASPIITSLASYVRGCWTTARIAKEQTVEKRFFQSVRQRRGEYDPDVLTKIREQGGSEIYMMLTSVKCRGASSWLRDVLLGTGSEKPWGLRPTPLPSLPVPVVTEIRQEATNRLIAMQQSGINLDQTALRKFLMELRSSYMSDLYEEARYKVDNMEKKMEDQMLEGGFLRALDQFIDDITTFPAAIIKGPVVRRKQKMMWNNSANAGYQLEIKEELVLEWERVDPFMIYPSPSSTDINDGYLFERHKLRQHELEEMIGVEGYDDGAIRNVLDEYGRNGLQDWLIVDSTKAQAEGRSTTAVMQNQEKTIDALQFWGQIPGQKLLDWGMSEADVPDPAKQYNAEVWLIGSYCIKATLNYDPLGRKPYFKASYEDVPGSFWGNSVADLVRDCQTMCNSAARSLSNNMSISSGPQVSINADRLPPGEDVTNMYPWKIWQFSADPMGGQGSPIDFFQPSSNTQELMAVYEKFSILADEYSGIPRYMTGDSPTGGAGRTATGMSMLMTNANKSIKQVVSNIDYNVMKPLLERLYYYNMRYSDDDSLKGDVEVMARGATAIIAKESAQVRRNEFLAATGNPIDMQIVGMEGRAAILREVASGLDMDVNEIVPPPEKLKLAKRMQEQAQQQLQMAQGPQGTPPNPTQNGQTLGNGAPIADNFQP